jgi:hypothetical protein
MDEELGGEQWELIPPRIFKLSRLQVYLAHIYCRSVVIHHVHEQSYSISIRRCP